MGLEQLRDEGLRRMSHRLYDTKTTTVLLQQHLRQDVRAAEPWPCHRICRTKPLGKRDISVFTALVTPMRGVDEQLGLTHSHHNDLNA